ncbi:unnamed protein product [Prunus armeniaca]
MLGFGTKIGDPAVVFSSKNTAMEQRRLKKEQLDDKAHLVVAATLVADVTTGHCHFTATPPPTLIAVLSTLTLLPPGATDHMTYNSDFTTLPPHRDHVLTANNVAAFVMGIGPDIQTREIFGRGTKKGGLYYVDDVATNQGVLHETTRPQTAQQNGIIESKNGQILIVARALLLGASVSKRFWMDALIYAVYLLNHLPSRVLDFRTPMQVFGCVFYVHLDQNQSKVDVYALCCVFLDFSPHQKGY